MEDGMGNELLQILDYIEQERGISRESLIRALENAILIGSRKSIHPASDLKVKIDPASGAIRAWAMLEVVDSIPTCDQLIIARAKERFPDVKIGDVVEWEVTPHNFGRIAAQTARQAMIQQLRKAEKENVQEEFADRIGTILNGVVRRFDAGNVIIDFQRAEGVMPPKEKVHGEQYQSGERINAYLLRVDINTSGPSLIVSRACPEFVQKLFEREVSEIHDGVVVIKGIAREAGNRTKVAVMSTDPRVDPVGACVGVRGNRVRNITAELGMERIDIVPWDEDIRKYATNALLPAKVQSVEINETKRELIVRVTEDQSKLAFGKKAQNVRLCSKLIGWNITIQNEEPKNEKNSFRDQLHQAALRLASELDISEETANLLISNGYVTVDGVKEAGREVLRELDGINADEINHAFDRLEA
ncbi:MAG: transcription termination factor NusA [Victivallales bacterium]|nr:transcription termination factor NusA [Victivallales bacterium]